MCWETVCHNCVLLEENSKQLKYFEPTALHDKHLTIYIFIYKYKLSDKERFARAWSQRRRISRSDCVKKKKLGKTFKYLYRRIFLGFLFEFTISIRKSSFSSLAYDPALSVPAQKCKTGFSQFAYLEKKQVFQLVVFRLARKTV